MAKVNIPSARLASSLKHIGDVVESRAAIAIFSNVLMRAEGKTLSLRGTDGDIDVRASINLEAPADGVTTMNAKRLADIVRTMKDGASVAIEWDDREAVVKSGRSRFTMPTLPPDDYPDFDAGGMTHEFTLPAGNLARLITKTAFAASTDASRRFLQGVFIHTVGDRLVAVATNGFILSRCSVVAPPGTSGMPGIIVPTKAARMIGKMADTEKGDAIVEVSPAKLAVTAGGTRIVTKLIDGTFPEYQRIIPSDHPNIAQVDLAAMQAAVQKSAIMVTDTKTQGGVFDFAEGRARIEAKDQSCGSIEEEIEIDYSGAPLRIGLKISFARDCLAAFNADRVTIHLGTPRAPCMITSDAEPDLATIIQPMAINGGG